MNYDLFVETDKHKTTFIRKSMWGNIWRYMQKIMFVFGMWDSLVEVKLWSAEEDASMGQFSSDAGGQNRV